MTRPLDRVAGAWLPAVVGGAATLVAAAGLEVRPPGGRGHWERTNFAGRRVSLLGGPAVAAGATTAALATALAGRVNPRNALAGGVAAAAAGAMGAVDDLGEDQPHRAKGIRGHLGALARGEVTTGVLKIAGIGAASVAAAALAVPARPGATAGTRTADVLTGAALVASTANLHNLFDLRPGRTLKVAGLVAGPLALSAPGTPHGALAAGACGVAAAGLPDDLRETTMLGDTGANALGALVGTALAAHPSRVVRAVALATAVGLTLASERVSFSAVISAADVLRRLDELGRRV
ncbi:hypothetical protein [Georgenia alba]|uniref:UDP-N-acetylmuramyl pentapeptide phosphotransferase/UDP-N-acetylglucosamine-1-phosphate transferase n=1 Tax=Georgenia alba TaxID=2233858 RepID=A0ABW2QD31_9MICO